MAPPKNPRSTSDAAVNDLLRHAAQASAETAHSDLFYRQLALHLARAATSDFQRARGVGAPDGAAAVAAFVSHEESNGSLRRGEITVHKGAGFRVRADVHQCPYTTTCQSNLRVLGEVPQCIRAITLIEAMSKRVPERPPMTYDLAPGLVDGTGPACEVQLRPAGIPNLDSIQLDTDPR